MLNCSFLYLLDCGECKEHIETLKGKSGEAMQIYLCTTLPQTTFSVSFHLYLKVLLFYMENIIRYSRPSLNLLTCVPFPKHIFNIINIVKNDSGHALDAAVFSTCVRLYVCMFTTVHYREHQNAVLCL